MWSLTCVTDVAALPLRLACRAGALVRPGLRCEQAVFCAPIRSAQREAREKRERLEAHRRLLAWQLGSLALAWHEHGQATDRARVARLVAAADRVVDVRTERDAEAADASGQFPPEQLHSRTASLLDGVAAHQRFVATVLSPAGNGPPSRLVQSWPLLVAYPAACAIGARLVTQHWSGIVAQVRNARDTLRGLLVGWVYEPAVRMLNTLRLGDAERRMLVTPYSLASDMQSLERMVEQLASDKLGLSGTALEQIATRVHDGDLSPVLELYERDIRSPLRSTITGTLIRTVLIQVQKAKVDLEVALSGIDRLLKSQELVIGAVGIAPALGIVYMLGSWLLDVLRSGVGGASSARQRYAARTASVRAWEALRRVDRLVARASEGSTGPRAYGDLLLDIAALRSTFASILRTACRRDRALGARLQTAIGHDLGELELVADKPGAWDSRSAVVERMWRSWSSLLSVERQLA